MVPIDGASRPAPIVRGNDVGKTKQQQYAGVQKPIIFHEAIKASLLLPIANSTTNASSVMHTPSAQAEVDHDKEPTDDRIAAPETWDKSTESLRSPVDDPKPTGLDMPMPPVLLQTPSSDTKTVSTNERHAGLRPMIEVPVLIARTDIHVDLQGCVDVPHSVACVTDIRWLVQSIKSRLSLPTNHLTVNGVLAANIEYQTNGIPSKVCTISTNLIWNKIQDVQFLYPPSLPSQREIMVYTFKDHQTGGFTTHREQVDRTTEHPISRLRRSRIVSTEKIECEGNTSHILIQVSAALSIDLLQLHLIDG